MKKVKLQLPTGEWDHLTTKYAADDNRQVDQNAFTEGTKNIDTESDGTIRKMKGGTQFYTLTNAAKDQHEAIFSDGVRHLLTVDGGELNFTAGSPTATSVTSGYSTGANFEFATTQDRVYFGNGVNANQVYDKTASYGGVGYSVPQTKAMGAQIPGTAATATIVAGAGVPAGGHTYKITFLYYGSEESNGSSASNLVTVVAGPNQQVDLSSIPIGGYGVTARKIYRDDNDGVYTLVGTISDNTTTIFSDNATGGTTPIPTDNGAPPVFGQVKLFLDRLWFAQISGEPFTLYFSEVGLPDIVQSTNFIDCNQEDPITALAVYRGRLIVFNRKSMGQIVGDTKDSFSYDPIQGSNNQAIGCVDNRTIQEIVLRGVPTLVWLSDRGFYGFNGSSIFYLSDNIEDLINVNIKQAVIQKNQKVDTSDADFNAGTASDGITVAGGQFSVRGYVDGTSTVGNNPRRTWNDTADWDGGSSLDNISTIGQSNQITTIPDNSQNPGTEGTRSVVIPSGIGITLPVSTDFTGETKPGTTFVSGFQAANRAHNIVAQPITPPRAGTIDSITFGVKGFPDVTVRLKVYRDSGNNPGSLVFTGGYTFVSGGGFESVSAATSISVSTNERIWIALERQTTDGFNFFWNASSSNSAPGSGNTKTFNGSVWVDIPSGSNAGARAAVDYTYTSTPIATSGTWTSTIIDTQSGSADPTDLTFTASYPASTSSVTTLIGGDNLDFAGNIIQDESQVINDHTGTTAITLGSRRYYQTVINLITSDDRNVPTISTAVEFDFSTTGEWISEAIDTTADSTVYNALTTTANTPGSSTVVTEIRTATTVPGLTAAPWVAFGSVTVRQYAQIRLTFTKDGANIPSVSLVDFTWTVVSNLISAEIDTNVDPSGWDVFQSDFNVNGGTIVFEMRSATTSGGLPGATWYTVTNGAFPTASLPHEQFVQWRATITATDGSVPNVSSITIKWFIGDVDSVRAASIFFNKNYYVSLAEFGNDENNIIVQLDANGKWRLKRGLGVSTFGFFFNDPYFSQSTAGVIGKFLEGLTDLGTNIEIDVRTRAFDYSSNFFDNSEFTKVPESFMIEGRGTGATYDVSYSLDDGDTFTNFIDVVTGSTTFTTTNDDKLFSRVFRAADNNGARAIIYRIHTNDEFDIKLHRIKASAFITRREPIITG